MVGSRSERIALLRSQMSPNEQLLKDIFIQEYLQDYDEIRAGIRAGMSMTAAKRNAKTFQFDTYIQLCITEAEMQEPPEDHREKVFRQVDSSYARLMMNSKVGVKERIAATAQRAALHGLNAPTKTQTDINLRGGIMVVPGISAIGEWESEAALSQLKLVSDAREPA